MPVTRMLVVLALAAAAGAWAQTEVTIEIYSDFECPYCARFAPAVRELEQQGVDGVKTRVEFKNFPLSFHANAQLAAQAAVAAGEQGKFWEMHDLIFANQRALTREDLLKHAGTLKLDLKRFTANLDSETVKKKIEADKADAAARKVQGTPTFFINGKEYSGTKTAAELKALVKADAARRAALSEITDALLGKGPASAAVTIEFFADLASPVSRSAHYVLDELMTRYAGRVRIQFRNFPLSFHPQAALAHEAALVAAREGRFWQMVNFIFDRQESVREQDLIAHAGRLGLDAIQFAEAIRNPRYTPRVDADVAAGFERGVRGSPAIFVNGRQIDGVPSLTALAEYVDAAVKGPGEAVARNEVKP